MTASALAEQLERFRSASADAEAFARREAALAAFETNGFPGRALEAWRYTDTRKISDMALDFAAPMPETALEDAIRALAARLPQYPERPLLVLADGHFLPGVSTVDGDTRNLLQVITESPAAAPAGATRPDRALTALNAAFARPLRLRFGAAETGPVPLTVLIVATRPGLAAQLRLTLEVAPGASAEVTLHFAGLTEATAGWTNIVMDVDQAESSRLELLRLQTLPRDHSLTTLLRPALRAGANLTVGTIDVGGAIVRTDIDATLLGENAAADLFGIASAAGGQHVDNHICVDHAAADTKSKQTFRSIVDEGGRAVFNGKVIVRPGSQRIDARQLSNNLLLSQNAEIDTKPELEIYADDVRCSHGATIGELDERQLFYLRSRGIDARTARQLLTFAFASSQLKRISSRELRHWLAARVTGSLDEPNVDLSDELLQAGFL